jgi:hypothetical protein
MRLAPFSRKTREQWTDDALVVGVSEYCEHRPPGLSWR